MRQFPRPAFDWRHLPIYRMNLTYVWVLLLSVLVFHESLNLFKILGVSVIVFGVSFLGRKDKE